MPPITSPPAGPQVTQNLEPHDTTNTTPVIITPSTPQRGRKYSRYPSTLSADPDRVPLHRRGTSKTYERLEDLLREAGYKETRVFTPEMERAEAKAEERRKNELYKESQRSGSGRSGVGAMMDYLVGWMPGGNKQDESFLSESESATATDDSQVWGRFQPSSPLAHKHTPTFASDSGSSLASPPDSGLVHSHHMLPHANPLVLVQQPSSANNLRTYAQVSAARGYLRHMASAPNMPKARAHSSARPATPGTPPLPTKWLESVTKAVLGTTNSDVHVGGPLPASRPASRQSHRTFRSTAQASALSDRTNRRPRLLPLSRELSPLIPSAFTAYLNPPQTASTSVTAAQVVCRSAPASRSSSRAGERLAMASSQDGSRVRRTAKSIRADGVPSLASTRLENDDVWAVQWMNGARVLHPSTDDDSDHEDEDDGEIDLARLLVPSKRQHSIRSLRQHLHRSESARALRSPDLRALQPWASGDEDEDKKAQSLRGRSKRNSLDDHDGHGYGWEVMGVPGFDQVGAKRRRALPTPWSNLGTSSGRA